jgi:hypothetical protein
MSAIFSHPPHQCPAGVQTRFLLNTPTTEAETIARARAIRILRSLCEALALEVVPGLMAPMTHVTINYSLVKMAIMTWRIIY